MKLNTGTTSQVSIKRGNKQILYYHGHKQKLSINQSWWRTKRRWGQGDRTILQHLFRANVKNLTSHQHKLRVNVESQWKFREWSKSFLLPFPTHILILVINCKQGLCFQMEPWILNGNSSEFCRYLLLYMHPRLSKENMEKVVQVEGRQNIQQDVICKSFSTKHADILVVGAHIFKCFLRKNK